MSQTAPRPLMVIRVSLRAALAALLLAGCAGESGIVLRGGQTEAQLAADRAQCLPFAQQHTETSPELAEAACLVARGYRAPLRLAQGPAGIGSLYATANRDAPAIVGDFEGCRVEAFNTPMPENRDAKGAGIFSHYFGRLFPRGFFVKAQTPDEWALKTFATCLTRRGYAVSDVTSAP